MEKIPNNGCSVFFVDTYFRVLWYSRTEQPMYFLKTWLKYLYSPMPHSQPIWEMGSFPFRMSSRAF